MTTAARLKTRSFRNPFFKGLHLVRARGWQRALYSALRKVASLPLLRTIVRIRRSELLVLQLDNAKVPRTTPKSFEVREATEHDFSALAEFFSNKQQTQARVDRGDVCFMTLCGGKIGAAVWMAVGPTVHTEDWEDLKCIFRFPVGAGWLYDGRGSKFGAWGTLMAKLPELAAKRGVKEFAALIDSNNWAALDSHKTLGYQYSGAVRAFGLFGVTFKACKAANRQLKSLPQTIAGYEFLSKHEIQ